MNYKILALKIFFMFILFLGVFGLSKNTLAATWTAANCSLSEVQAKVAAANRGDTVTVPRGSCTWKITLDLTKAIILRGAGQNANQDCDSGETCITNEIGTSSYLIRYRPSDATVDSLYTFKIEGFHFVGDTNEGILYLENDDLVNLNATYPTILTKMHITNNSFVNLDMLDSGYAIQVRGAMYPVIYLNYFKGDIRIGISGLKLSANENENGIGKPNWKYDTWKFGSSNSTYIEGNKFDQTLAQGNQTIENGWGGRSVIRYNEFNQVYTGGTFKNVVDNHGNYSYLRAGFGYEFYGNRLNITQTTPYRYILGYPHGGKVTIHNNKIFTPSNTKQTTAEIFEQTPDTLGCITDRLCGSGSGELYPGTYTCSIDGKPQHLSDSYFWNNRYAPDLSAGTLTAVGYATKYENMEITGITNSNPCKITTKMDHVLKTGDKVYITGIVSGTLATAINNKNWTITTTSKYNQFTIPLNSTALSTWESEPGGIVDGPNRLIEDTHYFQDDSNCTTNLCASGIGCGKTAPTGTCKNGTGYWVTSQSCAEVSGALIGRDHTANISGSLYRCESGVWKEYYKPYTYPHPLRGGITNTAPAAPAGVKVI